MASSTVKMDDGEIDLVYSDTLSKMDGLSTVLDTESGKHLTFDFMKHQRVKAFVLEPLESNDENNPENLILDVSGERIKYAPIQVEIHQKAIDVIVPDWLDTERWSIRFQKNFPGYRS
jgi:diacylglycerol kinase family enzyme